MKKLVSLGLLTLIILISGCNKDLEDKVVTCTMQATYTEGMDIKAVYKISAKNKYVTYVETVEEMKITDKEIRDEYYNTALEQAQPFKDIKYYEANIEVNDDIIRSVVKIDYEHINMDDLIKVNSGMQEYLNKGKIRLEDMVNAYKEIGVNCN